MVLLHQDLPPTKTRDLNDSLDYTAGKTERQVQKLESVMSKTQPPWVMPLLFMILGIALWLRVWGIGFGLPYEITYNQITYEEIQEVHRAFKLGAGEYQWRTFGKGGLYYLLFVEYALLYVVSWTVGWVNNPQEFALWFLQDRTVFFLMGRLTVAFMGTLTCLVLFLIGKYACDWRVGLAAAFIGATAYFHGAFSAVINVDIGLTLALWASMWAYLKYEETQQFQWLIGAGVLGGFAIAFKLPGAIILFLLLLAIGSCREKWQYPRQMIKESGVVVFTVLVTLTIVAPEWTIHVGRFYYNFSQVLGLTPRWSSEDDIQATIKSISVLRDHARTVYLKQLLKDYNIVLVFSALLGAGFGVLRRNRWDIIWSAFIIVFLGLMSAADHAEAERYLLPVMPALWLLSSRASVALSKYHWSLALIGLVCIVIMPLVALIRCDFEKTKPDTRVLAKEWIETNVPSGAKILMDAMRYRWIQGPPLNLDKSTLSRQVAGASQEGQDLGRGVSQQALTLYAKAMEQVKGPKYELYSTEHGLTIEDPAYYVQNCFDYIITSSYIWKRYARMNNQDRFPKSARFYQQLHTDPRFQMVYSIAPAPWERSGPIITVYRVIPTCNISSDNLRDSDRKGKSISTNGM